MEKMFVLGMGILDLFQFPHCYADTPRVENDKPRKRWFVSPCFWFEGRREPEKKSPQLRKRNMVHEYCFLFYKDHEQDETSILMRFYVNFQV